MAAYTFTHNTDVVDAEGGVIMPAGDYRIQDRQITLLSGQELMILVQRINLSTFKIENLSFLVKDVDLDAMSDSLTAGLSFRDELDNLIWGWLLTVHAADLVLSREPLIDELIPTPVKVV